MHCPICGYEESKVIDSRKTEDGQKTRRRRECLECEKRFTTYEIIESFPIVVVKRDGSRQPFNRDKPLEGLIRACINRSVPIETLDKAVNEIEVSIQNSLMREITSDQIGEMILKRLEEIDLVAYVRFASVYRKFKSLDEFMDILNSLRAEPTACE
ncbi:MAG: transcriptional regulator NrdR [Oscillospiraceae bacterium]|nr:transcriptional regulator NrdR [Oscillospiraceae bacterium]